MTKLMGKSIRKICVPISTRGNYAKLKSTLIAINNNKKLKLQLVLAGSILLDSYGNFKKIIEEDGFFISEEVPFLLKGDSKEIMAISSGIAQKEFAKCLSRLKPDIVLITADRFESLSFAQSALCMNCCIAHLEGGEVSGSIDERIRHAITKLSHYHFVSNKESAERVRLLGELEKNIIVSGNPSIDIINQLNLNNNKNLQFFLKSNQLLINTNEPYLVISQHPVVTEVGSFLYQIKETFKALENFKLQKLWILPNLDAGFNTVKDFLQNQNLDQMKLSIISSLPFDLYSVLLKKCSCLIGNSSSGIRECSYLGVPAVNIGNRQFGRLRGENTIDCDYSEKSIKEAIKFQIDHGQYSSSKIYGCGNSGEIISDNLSQFDLFLDKTITF